MPTHTCVLYTYVPVNRPLSPCIKAPTCFNRHLFQRRVLYCTIVLSGVRVAEEEQRTAMPRTLALNYDLRSAKKRTENAQTPALSMSLCFFSNTRHEDTAVLYPVHRVSSTIPATAVAGWFGSLADIRPKLNEISMLHTSVAGSFCYSSSRVEAREGSMPTWHCFAGMADSSGGRGRVEFDTRGKSETTRYFFRESFSCVRRAETSFFPVDGSPQPRFRWKKPETAWKQRGGRDTMCTATNLR